MCKTAPASLLPQILPDGLAGDLQDNHGGVKLPQGLDGRDIQSDDVGCVDSYRRGAEGVRVSVLRHFNTESTRCAQPGCLSLIKHEIR